MPRPIGEWSLDKLKILELYLRGYLQATAKAMERVYIDGFAGPGRNVVGATGRIVDGSPLIALAARGKDRPDLMFHRLFFIERNPTSARELRQVLADHEDPGRATVIEGDINVELPQLVQAINPRSPIFIFSDTEGIEPKWWTIEAISKWRTELLINFPLGMSINRNLDSDKTREFFGLPDWRELCDSREPRGVLDFYKNRLRSLGFNYTTRDDRLICTRDGKRLYYLILVSKVEAAARIMDWVLKQPDATGQTRMDFTERPQRETRC